jgi:Tfp pilus assembly protein PilF
MQDQGSDRVSTRAEHLAWCKQRAMEYLDQGDLTNAFASMTSDLRKHPDTEDHIGIQMGMMMLMAGHLSTAAEMRKFIEGFN